MIDHKDIPINTNQIPTISRKSTTCMIINTGVILTRSNSIALVRA